MTTNERAKEVYAQFGLAYYLAECLHAQLCITYAYLGFRSPTDATRSRIEEKLQRASGMTMGPLIESIKAYVPDCCTTLDQALTWRNRLAHGFWYERIPLLYTEHGITQFLEELEAAKQAFLEADRQLSSLCKPALSRLGINDEAIQYAQEQLQAGQTEPPLPTKRLPKKHERIVRAWRIPVGERWQTAFETEDGLLLALCEAGLGWSAYTMIAPQWILDAKLQPYLPATVATRPLLTGPWQYQLIFSGATLEVFKPEDSHTCHFRLRMPRSPAK